MKPDKKPEKENIWNVPNFLTLIRVILAVVLMYLIVASSDLTLILIIFLIAASTDFFDGQIARIFDLQTEFGRKFDIFADRFLWSSFVLVFVVYYSLRGLLTQGYYWAFVILMTRELISLPFALPAFFKKKPVPKVNYYGKTTTFLQGATIPLIILSMDIPNLFDFAFTLSALTGIVGFISATTYILALRKNERARTRKNKNRKS